MNRISIALVAALFASPIATADNDSEVTFTYDQTAPAAESYAKLAETAKKACLIQYRGSAISAAWGGVIRDCSEDLLDQVIAQVDDLEIVSLNNGGTSVKTFASINTNRAQ